MNFTNTVGRWALRAGGLLIAAAMTGCVSAGHFVDGNLKEIDVQQFKKTDPQHPVQVLFDFQTKGAENTRATEALKARVVDQVAASGIFSKVSDKPVDGNALLTIKINNVPITDNAAAKGFATGLTLGLAGSAVTDGYVCTANYTPPGATQAITKEVRHAIHTTIGNHEPPSNAVQTATAEAAVTMMLHQSISHLLSDVSLDPNFK